jgi:hypothetical protein
MRYPNRRYGNPTEFAYYAMGRTLSDLSRALRRDERTIRDWLSGRSKLPWWVPEILRLQRMESENICRQMFWQLPDHQRPVYTRLYLVASDGTLKLPVSLETKKP